MTAKKLESLIKQILDALIKKDMKFEEAKKLSENILNIGESISPTKRDASAGIGDRSETSPSPAPTKTEVFKSPTALISHFERLSKKIDRQSFGVIENGSPRKSLEGLSKSNRRNSIITRPDDYDDEVNDIIV